MVFSENTGGRKQLESEIKLSVEGKVAEILINRERESNALTSAMISDFMDVLDECNRNETIGVVVIRGTGKFFCAGANLKEAAEQKNGIEGYLFLGKIGELFSKIEALPKPVIAAVQGFALGGGCELAMACDLRLASESARFGFPEVNLGTFPAAGGISRLPSIVGIAKAKELIFMGEPISAQQALHIGLVNFLAPENEFEKKLVSLADSLADKSISAIGLAKCGLKAAIGMDSSTSRFLEALVGGLTFDSEDQKRKIAAFMEKKNVSGR